MYCEIAPATRVLRVVNCRQKKELLGADRPNCTGAHVLSRGLTAVVLNSRSLCLIANGRFLLSCFCDLTFTVKASLLISGKTESVSVSGVRRDV